MSEQIEPKPLTGQLRGLKPFKKGVSGNPAGRPKTLSVAQDLARNYTAEAVETLVAALRSPRERVPAAVALLDRGWGKPPQAIVGADGGNLAVMLVTGVRRAIDIDSEPTD